MSDSNARRPDSSFNAEYPYNQAILTRSGHEIHLNDTPGNESIRVAHTRGTYIEMENNGRLVAMVAERMYQYIKESLSVTADGHFDLKIGSTYNLNVDGSMLESVASNRNIGVGGDMIVGVRGALENHVTGDHSTTIGGDSNSLITGDDFRSTGGDSVNLVNGSRSDIVEGDLSITSSGAVEISTSDGVIHLRCDKFVVDANSIELVTPNGRIQLDTNALIRAEKIDLNP